MAERVESMPIVNIETKRIHRVRITPQVADTDYGGGVYHGRYLALYNQARDDFMYELGTPYSWFMEQGLGLTVAEANCRYLLPVHYRDEVWVTTRVAWYRVKSIGFVQEMEIKKETETLLANGLEINLVCVKFGRESVPLPEEMIQAIDLYYGGSG